MTELNEFIKTEASRCVKCGLCLPHCPTYLLKKHEGESPRGRIALLENLALGELDLTPQTQAYLDHCLACNACEKVCPVPVHYGKLITAGRAWMHQKKSKLFSLKKLILFLLPRLSFIRNWNISSLRPRAKRVESNPVLDCFAALQRSLRFIATAARNDERLAVRSMRDSHKEVIGILPGCIHTFFEKKVFTDTIKLLQHFNVEFSIINEFKCCGGLHLHAGDANTFQKLCTQNQSLFEQYDVILSTASGCASVLKEAFPKTNIMDIAEYFYPEFLKLNFSQKILFHLPCTANKKFFQENENSSFFILQHPHCCGASGTYFLEYPETSQQLASPIVEEIKKINPDVFITTNIGCALHLKKVLKKQGLSHIHIRHPVNLLAECLC